MPVEKFDVRIPRNEVSHTSNHVQNFTLDHRLNVRFSRCKTQVIRRLEENITNKTICEE